MSEKTQNKTIKELVRSCQKNAAGSQRDLYEHFFSYGMSISIRYNNSYEESREVLNDAFLKVFENIRKFKDNNFKAWLRRIIINTATDNYRKNQKHYYHDSIDDEETEQITAEELIEAQLSYNELLKFIQELTPAYRVVFNMYVLDGFKHDEIAKELGISTGASKSNLARARKALMGMVKKTFDYEYSKVIG